LTERDAFETVADTSYRDEAARYLREGRERRYPDVKKTRNQSGNAKNTSGGGQTGFDLDC